MGVISLNADDLSFLNTLLGEGEVSVRIQHPDGSESEIRETIFCGLWRVRHLHNRRLLTDRLEAGSAPRHYGKRRLPIRCLTTLCCLRLSLA